MKPCNRNRVLSPLAAAAVLVACLPLSSRADSGAYAEASVTDPQVVNSGIWWSYNYMTPGAANNYYNSPITSGNASGSATTAQAMATHTSTAYSVTSTAIADLSTATVSASGSNSGYVVGQYDVGSTGHTSSGIYDTLTFTAAAGATDTTVTTVGLTFTVNSSMLYDPSTAATPGNIQDEIETVFAMNGVGDARSFLFYDPSTGTVNPSTDNYPSAMTGTWTVIGDPSDETVTFMSQFSFTGTSFTSAFHEDANVYCFDGIQCSTTAGIAFALGDGVTLTSESGAFLSSLNSAVPEPESYAMMLAGLGVIGSLARRRSLKRAGGFQARDIVRREA